MGFEMTITFVRTGRRVGMKKVKGGKVRRQDVTVQEIEQIMVEKFKTKILRRVKNHDNQWLEKDNQTIEK